MSLPRRLLPKQTHTTTRRVSQRQFLLKPTPEVNQILLYALGVALERHPKVAFHGNFAHVNHKHEAVTDTHKPGETSELSDFYRDYHSLAARALNAHWGRGEAFWRPGRFGNVETHTPMDLEEQLLYMWTNGTKDGLVERPEDWPGVVFLPEDFGREIVVKKPTGAFFGGRRPKHLPSGPLNAEARRQAELAEAESEALKLSRQRERDQRRGRSRKRQRQLESQRKRRKQRKARAPRPVRDRSSLPAEVRIKIARPPGYEHLTLEEVRQHFRALLDARLAEIHAERRAEGLGYKGAAAILAESHTKRAGGTLPSFARNPCIAAKNVELRIALLQGLQAFRGRYREARVAWGKGNREVRFPLGTYGMVRFHQALVEVPP